ncbi:heparan-alpha-glucosaminide N-acetyltransferase domain-containing protein [Nocardiopsis sp. MG754419]|uniref:heparan-alpha-glucosaminide N-acetyltransferase domain-containing protein n=1 Tax=Nocardiopsis sp. MG754419 TaxID=2259865 RepID=UPI001BA82B85|nr:heparan-alpha-glucosaminide N-acetyltransferase domain-containing protein [Nocardiopsis sp. MG754419]
MTHPRQDPGHPEPVEQHTPAPNVPPRGGGRLDGVDLARWIAIAGMLVVHFRVPFMDPEHPVARLIEQYAWGRSTLVFAFIAGVSLALLSGGREPRTGVAGRTLAGRVAVRGAALMLIGWSLNAVIVSVEAPLTVIITYYGLYFLLALPFLRMVAQWTAVAAVAAVVIGPQLLFVLRRSHDEGGWMADLTLALNDVDPAQLLVHQGFLELLVYGFYPALAYLAAVLAGIAVGRLDLRSRIVRLRLACGGMLLAFVAYRGSWHAWDTWGIVWDLGPREEISGPIPTDDARWLLSSMSHTSTTPEILGGIGVSMVLLVGCLYVAERLPRAVAPFTAAGALALTIYVLHALLMAWQQTVDLESGRMALWVSEYASELFFVFAVVAAFLWRRTLGRGPLEAGVSRVAGLVVPGGRGPRPRSVPHDGAQ